MSASATIMNAVTFVQVEVSMATVRALSKQGYVWKEDGFGYLATDAEWDMIRCAAGESVDFGSPKTEADVVEEVSGLEREIVALAQPQFVVPEQDAADAEAIYTAVIAHEDAEAAAHHEEGSMIGALRQRAREKGTRFGWDVTLGWSDLRMLEVIGNAKTLKGAIDKVMAVTMPICRARKG